MIIACCRNNSHSTTSNNHNRKETMGNIFDSFDKAKWFKISGEKFGTFDELKAKSDEIIETIDVARS